MVTVYVLTTITGMVFGVYEDVGDAIAAEKLVAGGTIHEKQVLLRERSWR